MSANKPRKVWTAGTLTYTTGSLAILFFFLLWGDFTWAMRERAVLPSATLLIKQIGVTEFVFGLIIVSFPNFTNIFLSPIVSYLSDRHRGRWGRRIPYLLFTTPFIVLGLYILGGTNLLGNALNRLFPVLSEHQGKLIVFCVGWVLLDFGTTLATSLFNALVNDVVPQELLGRFFALFRLVSLASGVIFNYWLIAKVESHTFWIFLGIGTLYGIGLFSMCLKIKEGDYPPPEEAMAPGAGKSVVAHAVSSALTYLRQCFCMSYYRTYMLAWSLGIMAFVPINTFAIQYAQKSGVNMEQYGKYLVVICTVSLVISYFLGMLADKFHPLRMSILSLLVYLVFTLVAGFAMKNPANYGIMFLAHGILSGCYFTLSSSLPSRLLPASLFAQFCSATGIVLSIMKMLLGPCIGKILDLLNYNYNCLLPIAAVISLGGLLFLAKVYYDFQQFGGFKEYQAPTPN